MATPGTRERSARPLWIGVAVAAGLAAAAAAWFLPDPTESRSRRGRRPDNEAATAILEGIEEIAGLESRQEGSGRDGARRLVPALFREAVRESWFEFDYEQLLDQLVS